MSIAKSPLWESLIWAKNSLIVRSNSLHGRQKFPARVRRELARKILTRLPFWLPLTPPLTPESTKFPAFSLLAGNFEVRDGFARDCPLQQRVCCELNFASPRSWRTRGIGARSAARRSFPPYRLIDDRRVFAGVRLALVNDLAPIETV